MNSLKLKITKKDWTHILIFSVIFGFLVSLFLYLLNENLQDSSIFIFCIISSITITLFSFVLISFSNGIILPKINEKYWYFISFIFSFASGFLGFSLSYYIFYKFDFEITHLISNYWFAISCMIGFITFLIGMVLHQVVFLKYNNEMIKHEILKSKLKALENELNPHFLFNALNSISELIYIDQEKADKATIDLSKFLRNAIKNSSLITISDELKMVDTYVEIENIRFDGNICLKTDIRVDKLQKQIPKFSIQLLVENAIKHGYQDEKLEIDIKVHKDKIEILNNGKISENILFGTGLNNLEKRLKLLKIGSLSYGNINDKMKFTINMKDRS